MYSAIRTLFLGLLGLLIIGQMPVTAADDRFQVTSLAPDLMMISTNQGSYSNNSLVFTGEDGLLLVDTHGDSDREAFKKFVDVLTVPKETRKDICLPIFEIWKKDGARAAVDHYRQLEKNREQEFDFHETTLLNIGSKLYGRGLNADACEFFLGSIDQYPRSDYLYYTHYLAAKAFHRLGLPEKAIEHCWESMKINPGFESASKFLEELSKEPPEK